MVILALDTTMGACSAAVLTGDEVLSRLFRRFELRERGHAEAIVPMIREVLSEAGLAFEELDRIAVTVGPGTFTGVRIGVATARGLSLATGLPIVAVGSHAVMVRQLLDTGGSARAANATAIAVDARRGQVYLTLFDAEARALSATQVLTPDEAAELLPHDPVVAAGSGAKLLAAAARRLERPVTAVAFDLQPDAGVLAALAAERAPSEGPVLPLYLRPPDAKPQSDKAVPWLR